MQESPLGVRAMWCEELWHNSAAYKHWPCAQICGAAGLWMSRLDPLQAASLVLVISMCHPSVWTIKLRQVYVLSMNYTNVLNPPFISCQWVSHNPKRLTWCLLFLSVALIEHSNLKQPTQDRICLAHNSRSQCLIEDSCGRTLGRSLKQKLWRSSAWWLSLRLMLS